MANDGVSDNGDTLETCFIPGKLLQQQNKATKTTNCCDRRSSDPQFTNQTLTSDTDAEHFHLVSQIVGHVDLVKPRVFGREVDQ